MTTLSTHVERYIIHRRDAREFTPYTADQVTYVLSHLDRIHGNRPLNQFGTATLDRWRASVGGLAPGTIALYTAHVRQFCRWLHTREVITRDPSRVLGAVPQPRHVVVTFTADEMTRLLAYAPNPRARAIIELMYGAGARCCEVSRLQTEQYDPRSREALFTGKGGHQRIVPLDTSTTTALDAYLAETGRKRGPLIRSEVSPNRGIGAKTVSIYVRRWIAEAGLKEGPWDGRSPHAIRRTAVSEVCEASEDLREAQEFAGHRSLRTTEEHYARRLATAKVRGAVERRGRAA